MIRILNLTITVSLLVCGNNCFGDEPDSNQIYPSADPYNTGGWTLNPMVSDEFEAGKLDTAKWFIQGTDGVYKSNFIGRAPSQFSTKNVRVEDGKLKLQTKWDQEFKFTDKLDRTWKEKKDGLAYENITTAAVISKNQFLYGYMEIKAKAADASITSSFWMTGKGTELDVFEHLGRPSQSQKKHLETEIWSSIHDWNAGGKSTWTDRLQLDFRVADDFHVYGVEWDENYLKFHVDGILIRVVTREQVGEEGWTIKNPLWIWVDSETFPWHGIPAQQDLPVDFEIDYIRVWQKQPSNRSQQRAGILSAGKEAKQGSYLNETERRFFGFEGPIEVGEKKEGWWIPNEARKHFSVVDKHAATGKKSLRFTHSGSLANKAVVFAPHGSSNLKSGEHTFSMKVWLEPDSSIKKLRVILEDPWLEIEPIDLSGIEAGKWVTITQPFKRKSNSGEKDRIRILVQPDDVSGEKCTLYVDDLSLSKN